MFFVKNPPQMCYCEENSEPNKHQVVGISNHGNMPLLRLPRLSVLCTVWGTCMKSNTKFCISHVKQALCDEIHVI